MRRFSFLVSRFSFLVSRFLSSVPPILSSLLQRTRAGILVMLLVVLPLQGVVQLVAGIAVARVGRWSPRMVMPAMVAPRPPLVQCLDISQG